MTQEASWELQYNDVMLFMERYRRRPSKHRLEDHRMLNWMKHNRRLMAQGKLSPARREKFQLLLNLADSYRRLNQYAYQDSARQDGQPEPVRRGQWVEQSLF